MSKEKIFSDDDTIRALECCSSGYGNDSCEQCPYEKKDWKQDGTGGCTGQLMRDALALIKWLMNTTPWECEIKQSAGRSGKKENMDNGRFEELCKDIVLEYSNEHVHKDDGKQIKKEDVYIVWICKTLQNNKALLSTTVHGDGMYYEVTYNGDKQQIYFDAYKKVENMAIDVVD